MVLELALAYGVQLLWVQFVPHAWWVPNITLVVLVLSISYHPDRWLPASVLCGGMFVVWAVRHPVVHFSAYVCVGFVLYVLSRRINIKERRIPWLLITLAVFVLDLISVFFDGGLLPRVFGWILVHATLTVAVTPIIDFIFQGWQARTVPRHRRWIHYESL